MPRKTTLQPISSFPSFKKIATGFIILAIILLAFIVYFSFAKAIIILTVDEEPKTLSFDLTVSATSTDTDLNAELISKEIELNQNFEVQNFKQEPDLAVGQIKIINKHTQNQTLIKTTRFLSPQGILFRLKNTITVPANNEIVAEVYADEKGEKYNIEPTRFTIPGLSESLQQKIYAISEKSMTGGIKKIGVLTQEDLDSAKQKFEQNLNKIIKEKLEPALANATADRQKLENKVILENLILATILEQKFSNKVEEEISGFNLNAKVLAQTVLIDFEEMLEKAKENFKKETTSGETILSWDTDNFKYKLKDFNKENNLAIIQIDLTAKVAGNFDVDNFKTAEIAGFDKKGIEYYFSQFPGIKNIEIKFSPFWVKSAPALSDRIKIEIK